MLVGGGGERRGVGGREEGKKGGRGDVHRGSGIRSVCSESPDLGLRR